MCRVHSSMLNGWARTTQVGSCFIAKDLFRLSKIVIHFSIGKHSGQLVSVAIATPRNSSPHIAKVNMDVMPGGYPILQELQIGLTTVQKRRDNSATLLDVQSKVLTNVWLNISRRKAIRRIISKDCINTYIGSQVSLPCIPSKSKSNNSPNTIQCFHLLRTKTGGYKAMISNQKHWMPVPFI